MKQSLLLTGIVATLMFASTAFAQSTVTGTLTSGASGTTGTGSSLSGSVGTSSNSLSGTVVAPSTSTGGGGGGGGGGGASNGPPVGGGGGGGTGTIDICPNLDGVQSTLPAGDVIINGNCDPAGTANPGGSVLGASTSNVPGVPNTGEGGEAAVTLLSLALSLSALLGGSLYLASGLKSRHG